MGIEEEGGCLGIFEWGELDLEVIVYFLKLEGSLRGGMGYFWISILV